MYLTLHLFVLFVFGPNVILAGEIIQGHDDDVGYLVYCLLFIGLFWDCKALMGCDITDWFYWFETKLVILFLMVGYVLRTCQDVFINNYSIYLSLNYLSYICDDLYHVIIKVLNLLF